MKKTILTAFAALLVAVPAVQAQKVNESALLSKIEKSDADIADAKKGIKAATWINRGKAFYEVASAPTKDLFRGMEASMLKLNTAVGEPASTGQVTVNGENYQTMVYPYFTVYVKDGKVAAWLQTKVVMDGAIGHAIEAYNKAYELDPKVAEKAKNGLEQISNFCLEVGNADLDLGRHAEAADAYMQAFEAQSGQAYGEADPTLVYKAGLLRTFDGPKNPESFVLGAGYLNNALDMGYVDEEGNIYYYLFHCYYGQKAADPAFIPKAKDALLTGIEKFPKNERILDGLMSLYTTEEGVGDPADLVSLIDAAIADNPTNTDLWFGRGRIFYALKNYDESIASFAKIVELQPEMFEGNYYLGVFYTVKGDALNQEMNAKQYSSQSAYDADLAAVNAVYMSAVPWFEKAHQLKPEDADVLEYIKQLCFRLRDEEGMMDKYNHYNTLYKQAKGLE